MKRLCWILGIGAWAVLTVAYFVGLSNDFGAPAKPMTFAQIMDDRPKSLYYTARDFSDGVVVYKHQQDGHYALVVTRLPLPQLEAGTLREADVIAVLVDGEQYARVGIGAVITVYGSTSCQDTDKGRIYYVIGQTISQTSTVPIDNPEFSLIAAAAIDAADQTNLGILFFLWLPW